MKKYTSIIILSFISIFLFSACSNNEVELEENNDFVSQVEVSSLNDYKSLKTNYVYSAIVSALAEANISAKTSGTIVLDNANLGQLVSIGQKLAKIDDASNLEINSEVIQSSQIRQANIVVSQAKNSYDLALQNYNDLLASSVKDLRQAEIAKEQALTGLKNLDLNITESIKTAELAYETALLSVSQAELNKENRIKQLSQSRIDLNENASLLISSSLNIITSVLSNINNIAAFDKNNIVSIDYKNNLGALDSSTLIRSRNLYQQSRDRLEELKTKDNVDLEGVIDLVELNKDLTDSFKLLLSNTITSSNLSQTALANMQNQATSLQSQVANTLSQLKNIRQNINNFELEYKNIIDSLNSVYELSIVQKETALQNLNNIKTGNISQKDQADFNLLLAINQYDNLELKINSQLESTLASVESARLQYDNALLSLDNLYNVYTLFSPLEGKISLKNFSLGDTVRAGDLVYRVSQIDGLKVSFFVEQSILDNLYLGKEVLVNNNYIANIYSISPQVDPLSRKYKIEAILNDDANLSLQSIVNVSFEIEIKSDLDNIFYLPLSFLNISQLSNSIYLVNDDLVKEVEIEILEIIGESAKIQINDDYIDLKLIISANRRLTDGQLIEIK